MQDDSQSKFQVEYINGKTTLNHVPAQIEFYGTNVKAVLDSGEVLFDVPVIQVNKIATWSRVKLGNQLGYKVGDKDYNFIPKLTNVNAIDKRMSGGGAKGSTYSKASSRIGLILLILVIAFLVYQAATGHK